MLYHCVVVGGVATIIICWPVTKLHWRELHPTNEYIQKIDSECIKPDLKLPPPPIHGSTLRVSMSKSGIIAYFIRLPLHLHYCLSRSKRRHAALVQTMCCAISLIFFFSLLLQWPSRYNMNGDSYYYWPLYQKTTKDFIRRYLPPIPGLSSWRFPIKIHRSGRSS